MVELQPSKLVVWVRFPSPALRLTDDPKHTIVYGAGRVVAGVAAVAQLVECVLGKDEVKGSNPLSSSAFSCFTGLCHWRRDRFLVECLLARVESTIEMSRSG